MQDMQIVEGIAQRLQRRYIRLRRWALGLDVLLGGLGVAFLLTVVCTLAAWPASPWLL
jgi:hypothetical protein